MITPKKHDFKIRVNPELNRFTDVILFPEAVAKAKAFLTEVGMPDVKTVGKTTHN